MTDRPRSTMQHHWPAVAAGAATLLGMVSCGLTLMPLVVVGAPFVGTFVTLLLYRTLLRYGPVPPAGDDERRQLRTAAWVAWVVVVAACIGIGAIVDHAALPLAGSQGTDIIPISVATGVVLGAIIASRIGPTGAAYYGRRRAASAVAG